MRIRRLGWLWIPALLLGLAAGCNGPDTRATTTVRPTARPGANPNGMPKPPPPPAAPK